MARKRTATTELNHENWDQEDEPEEPGTFAVAPQEILEKRVVKTARRRLPAGEEGAQKSVFKGFSGFKVSSAPATSAFSFLKSNTSSSASTPTSSIFSNIITTSNGAAKTSGNGMTGEMKSTDTSVSINQNKPSTELKTTDMSEENKEKIFETSSEYFSKLKGLNESVTEWIKTHVSSNPFCILTPIFRDYERYLKEIESQYGQDKSATSSTTNVDKVEESKNSTITPSVKPLSSSETIKKSPTSNNATSLPSIFSNTNKNIFQGISASGEDNPFLKSNPVDRTQKSEENKTESKSLTFPQTSGTTAPTFSFGSNSYTSSSAGFCFARGTVMFGNSATAQESEASKGDSEDKDEDDEPPKVEIKPITEEGAVYEKRCKVFFKKDQGFSDRGIGVLFLKPTPTGKTQLIVRAETSLGNLLINTLLTESVPTKRANKNTVMIMCLPLPDSEPPPTSIFLRVKSSEDADSLLEALEKNKK
ncbi:nuclear pore complex protein Nup50 [Chelonus insularis]|uniref:nuclear pore complex protein Nup50 n=1 Tax=Chelonus insularis TaxID=460826 RepID=UPI00158C6964|nr:nuclear pore complex protein Nup50 [Chelonus insularis]